MERRNNENKLRECILASVVEIIQKSCDSDGQALRVQTAHRSDITSFTRYTQVLEHYKHFCFDWTASEYWIAKEYLYLLANLTEEKIPVQRIMEAIEEVGGHLKK